jgi:glycosyltransferase involved in cell wall biosynthesis/SAM-dependent methyltransferase
LRVIALTWRDLPNPSAGGAEVLIDRLLTGLKERGHDVALVAGGPVAEHEYETVNGGGTYSQYVAAPIISMTRFRRADVIIDVENGLPYFSPLWRRRPSVCLVHHVHTDQWHGHFPRPIAATCQAVERRIMPVVYRHRTFVAISNSTADDLVAIGVPRDHIRVIESGVDLPDTSALARSEEPLFLSLNRLVPHKRVVLLLDAWEIASQQIPGRLVIVGDGPELNRVRTQAAEIPRVEVMGRVSEETKHRLLAESWLILSAAHHEGWGMSIMEGAAAETPALAVDAPGIRDAIVPDVTGVLVKGPESELPTALATAWVALTADGPRRERLGRAAKERAAEFEWDVTIDRWESALNEVMREKSDKRRERSLTTKASGAIALGSVFSHHVKSETVHEKPKASVIAGLRRSVGLLKGFRTQYDDPDGFYTMLADDTVELVGEYHPIETQRVVDIGGGPGYFAEAFRRAGAESVFVEPFWESMTIPGRKLGYGVIGDGLSLPFANGAFDISHSSNVIEHVVDPRAFFDEMLRVVRPGGLMFLAFTNWFSPFGGHETSPWHYMGGKWAVERYERKLGYTPKNHFGTSLFRLDIADVLKWAKTTPQADLIDTFPRYYPSWTKGIVAIPGVREIVTWNLVVVLRRR